MKISFHFCLQRGEAEKGWVGVGVGGADASLRHKRKMCVNVASEARTS